MMLFGFRIKKRRLSNLLLEPLLQTKIGIYCIAMSLIFMAVVGLILYQNLGNLFDLFFELTDGRVKLHGVIAAYLQNIQALLFLATLAYIIGTIIVSIVYTHRLVGPTIAFKRHLDAIKEGDFAHRTVLRKGDAFQEVATRLNEVSELLETKKT
ncbi:MAG: methyl-accepting chemotaxis protein [Proteobacteria bacterium]|nr:MAG: methyl-accepting chemotaxis protein [Pseudomonadota bacterium]